MQSKWRKRWSVLMIFVMSIMVVSGCGNTTQPQEASSGQTVQQQTDNGGSATKSGEPIKLTYLVGDTAMQDWFTEYFDKYITGENEDNIIVELEYQKEATKVLQMKTAAGEVPDLLSVGLPQEMIDQGRFLDLSEEDWWDNLYPAAKELSTNVKDGKNYYVSFSSTVVGLFYNKEIFQELGLTDAKTWEEFVDNLTAIKEAYPDVDPLYVCGKEAYTFGHMLEFNVDGVAKQKLGYVGFENAASTNDLETLGWNADPDGVVATFARNMMELKDKGLVNENIVSATYDNQISAFVSGKAAMISQGTWALADIAKMDPDFTSIGFAAYPTIVPDTRNMIGSPLGGGITISSSCEHPDAAKKVVRDILEVTAMKDYCETTKSIPTNPNVDADWSFLKDDVNRVLGESAGATWTQNLPGAFNDDERGRLVQELFVDKYATPEEFAEEYVKRWTDAFNLNAE